MTLPEIPDEAIEAYWQSHLRRLGLTGQSPSTSSNLDCGHLAAAWPYLYAAALRHAADEIEGRSWVDSHDLRRMADDASS